MLKGKNHSNDKLLRITRKWIQSWVDNKKYRLKDSIRRTRKEPERLVPEFDSREGQLAVWEAVWDLKYTLEFAHGSIFTKDDPLQVPDWEVTLEQIGKLHTAEEIRAIKKQAEEADCNTGQ